LLVIPAKAGGASQRAGHPVLFLVLIRQSKASTRPTAERVTFFFTRVKKKVTKKESTLRGAPGFKSRKSAKVRTLPIHQTGAQKARSGK
jgi:hypothetical protein